MIGLGRMGANIVRRLNNHGIQSVVYDVNPDSVKALAAEGAIGADDLADFAKKLQAPRQVWIMVPSGVTNETIRLDGYFKDNGKQVLNKDKTPKLLEGTPEYLLFKKIIRGDAGDNVFSAFPGIREKGTKNSVGIMEAYEDRKAQGFKWNNFMLQRWTDHEGVEHRVLDRYEQNRMLIDLAAQPQHIRDVIDEELQKVAPKANKQIGTQLIKFCSKFELVKLAENVQPVADILSKPLLEIA